MCWKDGGSCYKESKLWGPVCWSCRFKNEYEQYTLVMYSLLLSAPVKVLQERDAFRKEWTDFKWNIIKYLNLRSEVIGKAICFESQTLKEGI